MRPKALIAGLLFLLLGGAALFMLVYAAVYARERAGDDIEASDCLIILGAKVYSGGPSPALKARLDRALELYGQGYAGYFIVCGAQGADEPIAEALSMRDYLIENGVPEGKVFCDTASTNTRENLAQAKAIMDENGFASAIICTTDYHAQRALWEARGMGMTACAARARYAFKGKALGRLRETVSWIAHYGLGIKGA